MKKETTLSILKEIRELLKELVVTMGEQKPMIQSLGMQPVRGYPGYIRLDMKSYMTPRYLLDECKKLFEIYSYINLYNITSDRKGDYTIYFKDIQEGEEEHANKSANQLKKEGHIGITLEERLLLEIEYFKKYGKHLDIDNWTLCSGSRDSDGSVPCVSFSPDGGGVGVSGSRPDGSDGFVRSRSAVSLPT